MGWGEVGWRRVGAGSGVGYGGGTGGRGGGVVVLEAVPSLVHLSRGRRRIIIGCGNGAM